MNNQKTKYRTEPMKMWGEVKEFKQKFFEDYLDIRKRGGFRILSGTAITLTIHAGFKDAAIMGAEPFSANIAFHRDFCIKCLEECERHGLGREICGYSKCVWGAMFLDQNVMPDGTLVDEWMKPDLATQFSIGPCHDKWFQYLSENSDTSYYLFDLPKAYPYNSENVINYITGQVLDYIEWAEKITGMTFDDEAFIEGVINETRSFKLWTEIMLLNQNIPAPLDEKTLFSFITPNMSRPYKKETGEFYERLLDETRDRVERKIAAVGNEQFRVITDAVPPWPNLQLYRYMEREYGVVVLGSPYVICLAGSWKFDDEGRIVPTPTPEEAGMKLDTREEAVRALVWYKTHFATETLYNIACGEVLHEVTFTIAKQWRADGGILHQNRGCTMQALGSIESRNAMAEAGIPCINYEESAADPRDLDMTNLKRKLDIFFEANKVKRLKSADSNSKV
ncbi:MAG: 2-hydroxyacyl-CoA dehydratase family protein [Thermodesulfobacteriota bacterium]|nr:2-hydroxyacyl-CoA dehydratase family protein [Thermodesulfobacteriota bacterium]